MKKHRKTIEYHQWCLQKHSTYKKQTQSQILVSKLIKETQTKSQRDKITYKITKHDEKRNKSRKISPYAHVWHLNSRQDNNQCAKQVMPLKKKPKNSW